MEAGDFGAAQHESLLALAIDPLDVEARYALGEALEAGGDATGAAEEFKKAGRTIERFTFVDVRDRSREHSFWFRHHFAQHKWFDAFSAFCLLPEDAMYRGEELLDDVSTAAAELGWWSVVAQLRDEASLAEIIPADRVACTQFAQACLQVGKRQVAEKAFAYAAENGSEIAAFYAGVLALGKGEARRAETFFERAPAGFSEYGLARIREMDGQAAEANELYKEALKEREFDVEWLCGAFDAARSAGDADQMKSVVSSFREAEPTFRTWYEVVPGLWLRGIELDTPWFPHSGYLTVTFFWSVRRPDDTEHFVVVKGNVGDSVAQAGRFFFHKLTVRNPFWEPRFEGGPGGQRYPLGFGKARECQSPPEQCRVVPDEQADHEGDQCLCMTGSRTAPNSRIASRRFNVSGGKCYLVGGRARTRDGTAQFVWEWFDASGQKVPSEVWNEIRVEEGGEWTCAARAVRAPRSAVSCSLKLGNWLREGGSYFDDVFFIEVPLDRSILELL
jgi:tetratricopeptide (TPR) repeat protein